MTKKNTKNRQTNSRVAFIVGLGCSIVPAVCTIITAIGSTFNNVSQAWFIATIVLAFLTMIFSIIGIIINHIQNKKTIVCHKQQQAALSDLETFVCDGRKTIEDNTYISFDVPNKAYKITVVKKYEILDLSKPYYIIRLHCDKFLGNGNESKKYYEENPVDWDNIELNISLSVKRKNGEHEEYRNIRFVEIERIANNYFFAKVEYAEQLPSGQVAQIPIALGDIISITYSFNISTKFWGNYIERRFSFFKEAVNVYFQKTHGFNINDLDITYVNTYGTIRKVPANTYKFIEQGIFYKLELPVKSENLLESKDSLYRIMWNANAIFNCSNLNTLNAEHLGMAAVIRGSD